MKSFDAYEPDDIRCGMRVWYWHNGLLFSDVIVQNMHKSFVLGDWHVIDKENAFAFKHEAIDSMRHYLKQIEKTKE